MIVNKPKGTYDILPSDTASWVKLEETIRRICKIYNYKEIRTPIFESSELYHRDANDVSDMVTKETYDFKDRSDRGITLRPEGTAGAVRAYIENKLYVSNDVCKLFYMGPMFRYERPQKGRQRQFHQFGIEAYGSNNPLMDAEVIACATAVIKGLGLKGIKVKINTIGDEESRLKYRDVLVEYFKQYEEDLCLDCKNRLIKNPLRILDCKVDREKEYFKNAPKISEFLNDYSKDHFNSVLKALNDMNIVYEVDERLVRGLDYYTQTVFEIEIDVKDFGAQNVICAGGRYNNLVKQLGGPDTPAIGLAFGMERLLLALELEKKSLVRPEQAHLFIIALGENAQKESSRLLNMCRLGGLTAEMDMLGRSIKSQFKQADALNAKFTAILGENELNDGTINVKNNDTDEQETIKLNDIYMYIVNKLRSNATSACAACKEKKDE